MTNYKHKPNYHAKRSCGLCKPHKRLGNSQEALLKRYLVQNEPLLST